MHEMCYARINMMFVVGILTKMDRRNLSPLESWQLDVTITLMMMQLEILARMES
jgi:hypothetical protein